MPLNGGHCLKAVCQGVLFVTKSSLHWDDHGLSCVLCYKDHHCTEMVKTSIKLMRIITTHKNIGLNETTLVL